MSQADLSLQYPYLHYLTIIRDLIHLLLTRFEVHNHHLDIKQSFRMCLTLYQTDPLNHTNFDLILTSPHLNPTINQPCLIIFLLLITQFLDQLMVLNPLHPKIRLANYHFNHLHPCYLYHRNDHQSPKVHHLPNCLHKTMLT